MAECPNCGAKVAEEAKFCSECGHLLEREKPAQEKPKRWKWKSIPFYLMVGLLVVVCGFLVMLLVQTQCAGPRGGGAARDEGDKVGANVACKQFVRDKLVAPSTAKFPWIDEMAITQVDAAADQWKVVGFVDAQNKMGAMIRAEYTCVVTYKGDDEWGVDDLAIEER